MGVFFSAGWTPCIGPVLGAILALSANQETVGQGTILLIAYSVGLGIPFLLTGLAVNQVAFALRRLHRWTRAVQIVTGVILFLFGILLFTDSLKIIAGWLLQRGLYFDFGL